MEAFRYFFPGSCNLCLSHTDYFWCESCENDLLFNIHNRCPVCANISANNLVCGNCIKNEPLFCRTEIFCAYQYPANQLIKKLKFDKRPEIAVAFANRFAEKLLQRPTLPQALIPVPLHRKRQRERGYNQSLVIANHLAKRLRLNVYNTLFTRNRATAPQSLLPVKHRKKNVANAFKINNRFKLKRVALIDDVITTGATIHELVKLLKNHCDEIEIWTIAKTDH